MPFFLDKQQKKETNPNMEESKLSGPIGLWQDPDFPASKKSIGRDDDNDIIWLRPSEFSSSYVKRSDPLVLFDGEKGSGDLIGSSEETFDDKFFMGALSAIASHPDDFVETLFVDDTDEGLDVGRLTVQFYRFGTWIKITIDTLIPCDSKSRIPIFGRSLRGNEVWVVLLEKAYAKLQGSYARMCNGNTTIEDVLVELTGGTCRRVSMEQKKSIKKGNDDDEEEEDDDEKKESRLSEIWDTISRHVESDSVVSCTKKSSSDSSEKSLFESSPDEVVGDELLGNRTYSVIYVKEIEDRRFLKIRNPYPKASWKGDWSASSEMWDEYPETTQAMIDDEYCEFSREEDDGTFWILLDDFAEIFQDLHILRVYSSEYNQYLIKGEWDGKSAAGSQELNVDISGSRKQLLSRTCPAENHVGWCKWIDGDSTWFNNPQYRIRVLKSSSSSSSSSSSTPQDEKIDEEKEDETRTTTTTNLVVSLLQYQQDEDKTNTPISTNFVIVKRDRKWSTRIWELHSRDIVQEVVASIPPRREISLDSVSLSPDYSYYIIPFTTQKSVPAKFALRLFTSSNTCLDVEVLNETHTTILSGQWERRKGKMVTAGGPLVSKSDRTNSRWSLNPQYALFIPPWRKTPTNVKIVVRSVQKTSSSNKHHKKNSSSSNNSTTKIGICVTRHSEESKTGGRRQRAKAPTKKLLLSQEPLEPLKPTSLNKTQLAHLAESNGVFDVERKHQVQRRDWAVLSSFSRSSDACILLRELTSTFCENSLIVVPMLDTDESGKYRIEFHSDLPIQIRPLSATRMKTHVGRWSPEQCGGCHVDRRKWQKNPSYRLKLHGIEGEQVKVKVSLSRPEDRWSKIMARDSVASMIGFYILSSRNDNDMRSAFEYNKSETFQTKFVPMSSVKTPDSFTIEVPPKDEHLLIVPCTYGPDQHGPFSLCVTSDIGFSLTEVG